MNRHSDTLLDLELTDVLGPCYSDKAARNGIRVIDALDKTFFDQRLRALEKIYRDEFGNHLQYDVEKEIEEFNEYRKTLKPFIIDSLEMVCKAQDAGQDILVEAANALCLDIGALPPWRVR